MKNLIAFVLLLLCGAVQAQTGGKVFDCRTLKSEILNEDRKYAIYLPPGYDTSERSYPVLYLLHPAGPKGTLPNQQGWVNYGMLKSFMDQAIESGKVAPMIVVTPDANFGTRRISYFNDPDNSFRFEDYFFEEFIPYIEKTYRCVPKKAAGPLPVLRWAAGLRFSMPCIIRTCLRLPVR